MKRKSGYMKRIGIVVGLLLLVFALAITSFEQAATPIKSSAQPTADLTGVDLDSVKGLGEVLTEQEALGMIAAAGPIEPVHQWTMSLDDVIQKNDDPIPMAPPFNPDVLVMNDPADQQNPRIAYDPGRSWLWTVFQHQGPDWEIGLAYSDDLGMTWNPGAFTITGDQLNPSLAITVTGDYMDIWYEEDTPGEEHYWRLIRSEDHGDNWAGYYWDWSGIGPGFDEHGLFQNMDAYSGPNTPMAVASDCLNLTSTTERTICYMYTDDLSTGSMRVVYFYSHLHQNEDWIHPSVISWIDSGWFTGIAWEKWNSSFGHWHIWFYQINFDASIFRLWSTEVIAAIIDFDFIAPDAAKEGTLITIYVQNGTVISDISLLFSTDGGVNGYFGNFNPGTPENEAYPAVVIDTVQNVHLAYVNNSQSITYWNFSGFFTVNDVGVGEDALDDYHAVDIKHLVSPMVVWTDARNLNDDIYYSDISGLVTYVITALPEYPVWNVYVDNVSYSPPAYFDWSVGEKHWIEVDPMNADPTDPTNIRWIFSSWSDAGGIAHAITATPSVTNITVAAFYDAEYNVTLTTTPGGLNVIVDMATYLSPVSFWWPMGDPHTIDVVSPQPRDSTSRWVWESWSDGGLKSHMIFVPGVEVYNANFTIEYMVNVTTNPAALDVEVDGFIYSNPVNTFWWLDGSTHDLNAISPQTVSPDEQWAFVDWSDAGAQSHQITVTGPATYTANYITQYNITFTTSPPGLDVEVDGVVYTTPINFFFDVGSTHTINAPSPQPGPSPDTQYIWSSWNDAGAQTHDILINGAGTYTANFDFQYEINVQTLPGGLDITVDAVQYTSPYTFWCTDGDTATLGAPSPQAGPTADQRYRWDSWSDMGVQTHPIVCNSPGTYTAFFVTQYQVNITTDPPGLDIEVEGIRYTAPHLEWVDQGGTRTINAPSPQIAVDTRAVFDHWSDGQPQSHMITVNGPGVYIAYFDTEFLVTITSTPATGLEILVDGVSQTTEYQFWCGNGQMVNLNAPSPQSAGSGMQYDWRSWSDGLGQSHTITCTGPDTYTANFVMQYQVTIATNPTALQVEIDGVTQTAAYTAWWDEDSVHTINAPSPQAGLTPDQRYRWDRWSDSGAQSHDVTISGPATYTAIFVKQYQITITTDPAGLDVIVDTVTQTAPYTDWWDESASLTVDVPDPQIITAGQERYVWDRWSDTGAKSHSISVLLSATYTAYMDHEYYLTVTSNYGDPQGEGWKLEDAVATFSVTTPYPPGATDTRYAFAAWTGDSTAMTPSATITMDSAKTVTATWTTQYLITITTDPAGLDVIVDTTTQTAPYTAWWNNNSQHTLDIADPQAGGTGVQYLFASWSDSGAQSHTVTITQPQTYTASLTTQYLLTVDSTYGTVTGAGWYDSGVTATFSVTTPVDGPTGTRYVFAAWSGDSTAATASATVSMDSAKTVTATWTTQYYLTVNSERGDPTGEGWYDAGSQATFSVTTPVGDYEFSGWTGDSTASSSTTTITMNAAKTVTATWEEVGFLEKFWWIFPIIIIIIIIVIVALLMMKRRKPGEEELPPPEEMEIPPEEEV